MSNKYNLSETEYEIMEMIWDRDDSLSFNEIMNYFNTERNRNWKKQTVQTYLTRLIDKGPLAFEKKGNKKIYFPSMPKEKYIQNWTKGLLNADFGGSVKNFIVALNGGEKLAPDDVDELRRLLEEE